MKNAMRTLPILGLLASALALTACGGGGGGASGGGSPVMPPSPQSTPCPAGYTGSPPNCTAPSSTSTSSVSGTLVNDAGSPVAGQPVAIAAWVPANSPYVQVATTGADGSFSFTTAPGHYLMRIGTDTPNAPTGTVHDNITLSAGNAPLVAPTMPPQPNVSNPPIEASGKYRMSTLTSVETECFAAANSHRVALGLVPFIADEWLLEDSRNYSAGQIATNQGATGTKQLSGRSAGADGPATCTAFENQLFTPGTPGNNLAIDPQSIWASAEVAFDGHPGVNQWLSTAQWMHDPRTETASDPLYLGWP